MYAELGSFLWHILTQKAIWKDGELWTAVILSIAAGVWYEHNPEVPAKIRAHFGEILNVTSIIFGFTLTTLTFYIQAASSWKTNGKVREVAEKLVDWHVWTVICLLALISYILVLWLIGGRYLTSSRGEAIKYALLTFLVSYSGFQILNDALTIWWAFRNRDKLQGPPNCNGQNQQS